MRVVVAHANYRQPGGEDKHVAELSGLLAEKHTVRSLLLENEAMDHASAPSRMLGTDGYGKILEHHIRGFQPDVIHLHNSYPSFGPHVFRTAKRLRIPLVMTLHNHRLRCPNGYFYTHDGPCQRCAEGNYLNAVRHNCLGSVSQSAAYAVSLWIHRFLLHVEDDVTRFFAPSVFIHGEMTQMGLPLDKVRIVRNFVRAPQTRSMVGSSGAFIGRFSLEKGLDSLLRALQIAGDPPFLLVGTGSEEQHLRSLCARLGLARVEFLGYLEPSRMQQVFERIKYVVIPSTGPEVASLAGIEALSHARPLVVSDQGGLPELVSNANGMAFRHDDQSALAGFLKEMSAAPPSVVERMGKASLDLYESNYTPAGYLMRIETVYREAIASTSSH